MKILHVLDYSLRSRQAGYTIRSKYIFDTQSEIGLEPIVATRFKDAHLMDGKRLIEEEYLDGVLYVNDMTQASIDRHFKSLGVRQIPYSSVLHREGLQRQFQNHISRVVEVHRPEVIHVASPAQNALISAEVGQKYGLPVVYEVRGLWHESGVVQGMLNTSSKEYRNRHFLFLEAMRRADQIITLAETMKEDFIREGIPEKKIFIVPNGVDTSKFAPRPYPTELAERLGLCSDSVTIGHIGSIRNLEGLRWLLKAGKTLLARHPQIEILIVGDGDELASLQRLTKELNLDSVVRFTGAVPHEDILDYYALIDIFAIPRVRSRVTELVTPIKPYEAMAMRKAIIVSDVAALREIVDDGTTGIVCNADDPDDLAQKCSRKEAVCLMLVEPMLFVHLSIKEDSIMTQLTSRISSEADLKAHIASYPELYEDLAVDALEERLEMWCFINSCGADDGGHCFIDICGIDLSNNCGADVCGTDYNGGNCLADACVADGGSSCLADGCLSDNDGGCKIDRCSTDDGTCLPYGPGCSTDECSVNS